MKRTNISYLLISIIISTTFAACKSEKDTRLNRFVQGFSSRFNSYFHAKEKLDNSVKTLAETHIDDFTDVLEVYPYGNEATGASIQPTMDEVYKKASWVITERPLSKWIDDSYLLIAKSHFFKRDYYVAIETFQYVASKYKGEQIAYEAQIWIAKSQIQQEKYNEAQALLSQIKATDGFPEELKGMLNATTAWVFIREKKYGPAIEPLLVALDESKDRQEKIRYRYILAQLYLIVDQYKEANAMFTKVIKMNPPYEFSFNAKISLAKAVNKNDKGGLKSAKTYLTRMLKDDKNISYFDQIYYELGNIELYNDNVSGALSNYEMSARFAGKNKNQQVKTYLALANTYFEVPNYEKAQAYYDSTAAVIDETYPDYNEIIQKRNVLSDLIDNIVVLNTNDSLLALATMPEAQLKAMLWEKAVKQAEDAERRQLEQEMQEDFDPNMFGNNQQTTLPGANANVGGKWYFYNPAAVGSGVNDFELKWGKRPLIDNWRLNDKIKEANITVDTAGSSGPKEGEGLDSFIYKQLIAGVTDDTADINEMHLENQEALKNIGSIYQNVINDFDEAIKSYKSLLSRYPKSKYEPEALYNLYKIYDELGNKEKSEEYKNKLLGEYPTSSYSKIINKSTAELLENNADKEVVLFYENTYRLYLSGDYKGTLSNCKIASYKYAGSVLQPKFDYLKAMATGKTGDLEGFKKELNYVINSYPNTEIAEEAQRTLDILNKTASKDDAEDEYYKFNPDEAHYYINIIDAKTNIGGLQAAYSDHNQKFHSLDGLQITNLLLNTINQLIFVKGFSNKDDAEKYKREIANQQDFFSKQNISNFTHVTISASNFTLLLADKNIDKYLAFYKKYYDTK